MTIRVFLLCILLTAGHAGAGAAILLISERPMSARMITSDELGNIYAIHNDNTLARYNDRGDSTGAYRSGMNGELGSVDATNPLRLVLYYPAYNKVIMLDRQLALKAEVDLRKRSIFTATAVATASDGNLWVYDPGEARIVKLDEQGNEVASGTDLRQQLHFVPKAAFLLERDRRLYLCDTAQGILVFDQFATHITTLPFKGISSIQAYGQQLVYTKGDTLHSYDMQTGAAQQRTTPLGNGILGLRLLKSEGRAWVTVRTAMLRRDRLTLILWPLAQDIEMLYDK